MVQPFKCLTCRARKLKCDETRPVCGTCKIRGRPCVYPANDPSIFPVQRPIARAKETSAHSFQHQGQGLRLRTARTVEKGSGLLQVFVPMQRTGKRSRVPLLQPKSPPMGTYLEENFSNNAAPRNALTSPQSRLLSRWAVMMRSTTSASYPLQAFSLWIDAFPRRIGSDKTLDLAMHYFVEGGEAFCRRHEVNASSAPVDSENALTSLRRAISLQRVDDNTLLAISLHVFAEVFITLGSFHYVPHIRAISQILQSRNVSLASIEKDLDFMLINSTYLEEITDALRHGRDSIYDRVASTSKTTAQCGRSTALDVASLALIQHFVKIPRLARLVRACAASPVNKTLLSVTKQLAKELFFNPVGDLVTQCLGEVSRTPTTSPHVAQVFIYSFQYSSVEEFALAVKVETYRVLLSGILETFYGLYPFESPVDIEVIKSQGLDAATAIAMSVNYALTMDGTLPLAALRILTPMQYSFGAWYRLAKRHSGNKQGMYGELMEGWSLSIANGILKDWKAPEDSLTDIRIRSKGFAGEPIVFQVNYNFDSAA